MYIAVTMLNMVDFYIVHVIINIVAFGGEFYAFLFPKTQSVMTILSDCKTVTNNVDKSA